MKKTSIFGVILLLYTFFNTAKAQDSNYDPVNQQLQNSRILNNHFFGFALYDMDQNRYLTSINADKLFTPASNTKIFTTLTALSLLGDSIPGIEYVERGDSLLVWGTGDPTFLHNRVNNHKVFKFLKSTHKKIFIVAQKMTNRFFANGWTMDDFEAYYQPEISTFPIYGNVVTLREKRDRLRAEPDFFQPFLKTLPEPKSGEFALSRSFHENEFWQSKSSVPNNYVNEVPFIHSYPLLVKLLADTLHKPVELLDIYSKPSDTRIIYSTSTLQLIRDLMLPSDNFLADQLLLMASWKQFGIFDTYLARNWMINNYYKNFSYSVNIYDGSGLSFYNKVSPNAMIDVLMAIKNRVPDEAARFKLFPKGGVDGTLRRSYALDKGEAFVYAKTGTMTGVYNQSGYLITRSGKRLAFSFLNNNFLEEDESAIRKEMVRIITFVRQNY